MMPTQTILNSNSMAFQETSHNSTTISLKLAAKPVKVRRTRQPKNPQLSVARRNERERNRVKMVNNGFALLREHLPIEDLQECCESDGDTPDGSGPKGGPKAKKYSKVETLRAAIQRIRMLEDLIRATEPGFESINIMPSSNANSYDDEPLSCGSSGSPATVGSSSMHQQGPTSQSQFASQQAGGNCHQLYATNQQGQFIKLEPQHQQPTYNYTHQMPSPQDSQGSQTSHNHHQQTQVHQQQAQYSFQPETTLESMPSHTHLWIQQHQSSFMEQTVAANNEWYQQQQQQQQQQQFPVQQQQLAESPEVAQSQQQMLQQPEPIWFSGHSPTAAGQPTQNHPQSSPFNHPHQQHQISLYSQ